MSNVLPTGDQIAAAYLMQKAGSTVARYRSGRAHLMDSRLVGHAKCGAVLLPQNYQLSTDTRLGVGEEWCYSCLGNALEYIERDRYRYQH